MVDARLESRGIPEAYMATYVEDFRGAKLSHLMDHAYRSSRVGQIRGSTDEVTAAYTISYVRIAEEKVRSRWCAIDGRTLTLEVVGYSEPH